MEILKNLSITVANDLHAVWAYEWTLIYLRSTQVPFIYKNVHPVASFKKNQRPKMFIVYTIDPQQLKTIPNFFQTTTYV